VSAGRANAAALAAAAASGLRRFKAIAEAAAGSPVTIEMEALAPGLAAVVADVALAAELAGALADAVVYLPTIVAAIAALPDFRPRPMDAADPVFLERERELEE